MKTMGVEMHDMSIKPEKTEGETPKVDMPRYKSLYLDGDSAQPLMSFENGTELLMVAHVKLTGKATKENLSGKDTQNVDIDILEAGFKPYGKTKPEEMDEKELNEKINDEMSA